MFDGSACAQTHLLIDHVAGPVRLVRQWHHRSSLRSGKIVRSADKERASTSSASQGNNNDMGLLLYARDEIDRGTDWNCSLQELVRYAAGSEPRQVLAPTLPDFISTRTI